MYCDFFWGEQGLQTIFLSKIKIYCFQNVKLDDLITNHPTCNYQTCTVTELFGLVTSKCIVIVLRGVLTKNYLSKIKISFFQNVELVELITNHHTCYYPLCTVTELFGLVTFKCIVIFCWGGSSPKFFFVQN